LTILAGATIRAIATTIRVSAIAAIAMTSGISLDIGRTSGTGIAIAMTIRGN
jgi:hypothetical protein